MKKTLHGLSKTPEYYIWSAMRQRCENPKDLGYYNYGGRGIGVCVEWKEFVNFYNDMGVRPSGSHQIDRIDNEGDYTPENCHWVTITENMNNRRSSVFFTYNGVEKTLKQFSRQYKIPYKTLWARIHITKWSIGKALTTPLNSVKKNYLKITHNGKTQNLASWAREFGLPWSTLNNRLLRGSSIEEALTKDI